MDAGKQAVPDIAADVLPAGHHDDGICGEQSHHRFGDPLHEDTDAEAEPCGNEDGVPQGPGGAVVFAGADVLGTQRRDGGQHGGRHQEQEADDLFHNAHGGGVAQAAAVGDDGDDQEGDLDEPVLERHGKADLQDLLQNAPPGTEVPAVEFDAGLPLEDHHQGYHHADGLGEGGAQRRTGGAQSHGADEQIVQGDVGHTGHGDEVHGAFGIAQPPEDGTDDVVGGDAGNADEADGQVGGGAGHGFLGVDMTATIGRTSARKTTIRATDTAMNSETVLPMMAEIFLWSWAPMARPMLTVVPMASPTIMTVIMCMTWLPTETAVVEAAPSYWPMMNRSAMP